MLLPAKLEQLEQNSSLIVEGKVVSLHSYWNSDHTRIYTSNKIEIYKTFKGVDAPAFIEVITEGGVLDNKATVITNTLVLNVGQYGTFFLYKETYKTSVKNTPAAYHVYADMQGFFAYNLEEKTATGVFERFNSIEKEFYIKMELLTEKKMRSKKQLLFPSSQSNKVLVVPAIASFSPSTIHAGTKEVLTINGSGFGATRGAGFVEFRLASQTLNTVRPNDQEYISWTDSQIQLFVPNRGLNGAGQILGSAATGTIKVTNNDLSTTTSSSSLVVEYSVFNAIAGTPISGPVFLLNLVNLNSNGGYTFQRNNAFAANTAASAAFDRAFNNWRCTVGINWLQGSNTTVDRHLSDGVSVITFDNTAPLPANVLGRGELSLDLNNSCGTAFVSVVDCDIVFSATAAGNTWNFSTNAPAATQADFETVALHELGHLAGLDHSLETCVMFPSVSLGVSKRVLDTEDINAGNFMVSRSTANGTCTHTAMIPFSQSNVPTISISTPSLTVCASTSTTFTATTTNASGATFEWKKNGITVSTSANSFTTASLANNDLITCILSVPGFCSVVSNSLTMTVHPLPPLQSVIGNGCYAQNVPVTYSATNNIPNATYVWTVSPGVAFNGANNTASVSLTFPNNLNSASLSVVAFLNGCRHQLTNVRTVFATPLQPASLTGQTIGLCGASSIPYTAATVANATGYSWSGSNGVSFNSPINQSSITADFPASFTSSIISVSALNNTCPSAPRSLTVQAISAQPTSITGPTNIIFSGSSASGTFTTPVVSGATSYLWSSPSAGVTVISGQGTRTARFSTTSLGSKTICVRAVNNCGQSAQKCITVNLSLRMAEENDNIIDFTVYPNPFDDRIIIDSSNDPDEQSVNIKIYDLTGKEVLVQEFKDPAEEKEINTKRLTNGVYLIQIISGERIQSLKMVK